MLADLVLRLTEPRSAQAPVSNHRGLLSNEYSLRDHGLELADSVTIDPHKWFYAPLDAGALLVKDEARLTASFGMKPSYLTNEMDQAKERYQYYVHGFEQSRRGTRRVEAFEFRESAWSLY